jgi:hypothetical protein
MFSPEELQKAAADWRRVMEEEKAVMAAVNSPARREAARLRREREDELGETYPTYTHYDYLRDIRAEQAFEREALER